MSGIPFVAIEEEFLKEHKENCKFIPELRKPYWFINSEGWITYTVNLDGDSDKWCIENNPVFKTRNECRKYKDYLIALNKYSYEFSKEEWEDRSIEKLSLFWDHETKKIGKIWRYVCKMKSHYFKTVDDINAFRNEIGDEAIEKFMFGIYR